MALVEAESRLGHRRCVRLRLERALPAGQDLVRYLQAKISHTAHTIDLPVAV
jgi:hypothetical protein